MRPERGDEGISVKLMGGGGGGGGPPNLWKTPTPYIFLGLTIMMGVIAVALLVLICTRRRTTSPSSSSSSSDEKAAAAARALVPLDREPKVVVFMPGDGHAPSFLASVKPLAAGDGAAAAV
ncbi:protein GLUTAMINE DUMPER 6 [Sorghum bicolor]|uniref:Uncharacterized protein n=1 Tax=Sorghum bicolor TaxID=4558 RepID=C5Z695_SORBI|nr:protein GLUTAMINE DUMPER 6 [Sorghum bicolor]EER88683.1 hypothetical protein SORBI_3010G198500 [Sorghum bicolor]|eukprot:XP_002437316.1 protein GLUTAMINE DUMPER 6 [Sorghum bicolor]